MIVEKRFASIERKGIIERLLDLAGQRLLVERLLALMAAPGSPLYPLALLTML